MLPLDPYFGLQCLLSKNRDSSLHNLSTIIKTKRSALLQYYHLICLQQYHPEHARSRLILEAKQGQAWLVLGWEGNEGQLVNSWF